MELNNLEEKYIKNIVEIEKECFACPWSGNAFEKDIENKNAVYCVADENGSAVGYVGGYVVFDTVYINNIAVSGTYRNMGIGTALLNDFINKCKDKIITLEVRRSNLTAIHLYEKFGFEIVGERRGFYSNPKEDALIMTRENT